MKGLIITVMVLVSGVALAGNKPPLDADCNRMATNAKGFAELKQGGIATTPDQLSKFVVAPTVASYPIRSVLQYVLAAPDSSPDQVYASLYNKCTLMGYKELFTYFTEREEVDGLRLQIDQQNQTITTLRQQVTTLQTENASLKYPVTPPKRPLPTAPVRRTSEVVPSAPTPIFARTTQLPVGCTREDGTACGSR